MLVQSILFCVAVDCTNRTKLLALLTLFLLSFIGNILQCYRFERSSQDVDPDLRHKYFGLRQAAEGADRDDDSNELGLFGAVW